METYTIQNLQDGTQALLRGSDKATIPFDDGNMDYVAYTKWLEAGGVPTEGLPSPEIAPVIGPVV